MKQQKGNDIYCDGGAEIVYELLNHHLFDRIIVSVIPHLLGDGILLFKDNNIEQLLKFKLSKSYPSRLVQLWYEVRNDTQKMESKLSKRLADLVNALPLKDGIRVLEIGCGPGAMAREISRRIDNGHILAIDRSAKAIQQANIGSKTEIESGKLSFRQVAIEKFELDSNEKQFDIAVAVRVGALDGRHPEIEKQSLTKISKALKKEGKLFIDGGNPLKEIKLDGYRLNPSP